MLLTNEDFCIEKIAKSGQVFRMNKRADGWWQLVAMDKLLLLREPEGAEPEADGCIYGAELMCSEYEYNGYWKRYFDMFSDYADYRSAVDPEDLFLTEAAEYGRGIRILMQDPWEMLITFIISQRKNIPAIKSCVEAICRKFGRRIEDEKAEGGFYYAFPTPDELSGASEEELRSCSLGYRAPYIKATATEIAGEYYFVLDSLLLAENEDLLGVLKGFTGVGTKVANCISLFGYHRIDAFPIDVWISRILEEHYPNGFPFERYKGFAGIMQQYMFFYAISHK